MNLEKFLQENNPQQQIDKLSKKLNNKKVVVYGAGQYFDLVYKNYDLSKLNIVALCDKKFEFDSNNPYKYPAITPMELKDFDLDCLVVVLINDYNVTMTIDKEILKNSKNENIRILPLITPTLKFILKLFFNQI